MKETLILAFVMVFSLAVILTVVIIKYEEADQRAHLLMQYNKALEVSNDSLKVVSTNIFKAFAHQNSRVFYLESKGCK